MKRVALSFFLISILISTALPQLKYGITAGINFSTLLGSDYKDTDLRKGFTAGFYLEHAFANSIFSFCPALIFSSKGCTSKTRHNEESFDATYETDYKYNYFEFPLLFKLTLPSESAYSAFLTAGPYIGILQEATITQKVRYGGSYSISAIMHPIKNDVDLGFSAGIGASYKLTGGSLSLELLYSLGFTNVIEDYYYSDNTNSCLSLMASMGF